MRIKSKVVQIPNSATIAQMETALDTHLNAGWILVEVFTLGASTYAILTKKIAE